MKVFTGQNVFSAALHRTKEMYEKGNVLVSFSAGKDSGVILELAIAVARKLGKLPVQVVMRDEEIMFPGTYEYAERIANRPEVEFHWLVANQPIVNIFSRTEPYFWVFDPLVEPDKWVRKPPAFAQYIKEQNIQHITTPAIVDFKNDLDTYVLTGLRASESMNRKMAIFSKGGYCTKRKQSSGNYTATPIYDWSDGDVYRFIKEKETDYNSAYDAMLRGGVAKSNMRIAPPTMAARAVKDLDFARRTWPQWFERVSDRLPGVRTAAMFGIRAVKPNRRYGETWQSCFQRECIDEAPPWIAERSRKAESIILKRYAAKGIHEIPEASGGNVGTMGSSYKALAGIMYNGDPFAMKITGLKVVEPEFFRKGAGYWGGKPQW